MVILGKFKQNKLRIISISALVVASLILVFIYSESYGYFTLNNDITPDIKADSEIDAACCYFDVTRLKTYCYCDPYTNCGYRGGPRKTGCNTDNDCGACQSCDKSKNECYQRCPTELCTVCYADPKTCISGGKCPGEGNCGGKTIKIDI